MLGPRIHAILTRPFQGFSGLITQGVALIITSEVNDTCWIAAALLTDAYPA